MARRGGVGRLPLGGPWTELARARRLRPRGEECQPTRRALPQVSQRDVEVGPAFVGRGQMCPRGAVGRRLDRRTVELVVRDS